MSVFRITTVALSLMLAIAIVRILNAQENMQAKESGQVTGNAAQQKQLNKQGHEKKMDEAKMQFGNFSVSLAVKDIKASKAFYEKLDFKQVGGKLEQNFVIMQNNSTTIGLFQGMFESNILTFNPGWNAKSETLDNFQDVRDLQAKIKDRGIKLTTEADAASTGPASFVVVDPDGNAILVDQHVAKPE